MRTRTHLTTPPGQEPELSAPSRSGEAYVPGLAIPEEPHVPGRYRRLRVALGLVVVLALVGFVAVRVTTAGQTFDPALDPEFAPGGEAPVDDASDGGLPGEG